MNWKTRAERLSISRTSGQIALHYCFFGVTTDAVAAYGGPSVSLEYVDYVKAGGKVVAIGQGEPGRAALYSRKNDLPCPVLCDPTFKVYEAYDLLEGLPSQVFFDASDELLRCDPQAGREFAKLREKTDRALVDSPWLLPGEFVVDRKGVVRLAYRYQFCEDWPDPLVLVGALKEASWKR